MALDQAGNRGYRGRQEEAPRRKPFPEAPPAPPGAVVYNKKVTWSDVDPSQHVNNAKYLDYFQEANLQVVETFGLPSDHSLEDGIAWFARKARVEYLQQARLGDPLEITTYLSNLKRVSVIRHYLVRYADTQELVVRGFVQYATVDFTTGRPVRIPVDSLKALTPNLAEKVND